MNKQFIDKLVRDLEVDRANRGHLKGRRALKELLDKLFPNLQVNMKDLAMNDDGVWYLRLTPNYTLRAVTDTIYIHGQCRECGSGPSVPCGGEASLKAKLGKLYCHRCCREVEP